MRLRWFTLIELLLALVVISVGLMSVIGMMHAALNYTDRAKQKTVGINIAKEGVESVYTIRDTNWLRRSGKKDANRLCTHPNLALDASEESCGDRIQSWSYVILYTGDDGEKVFYPYLSSVAWHLDVAEYPAQKWPFLVSYGTWSGNPFGIPIRHSSTISSWGVKFYREIRGLWLYQKDTNSEWWNFITCDNWSDTYTKVSITGNNSTVACGDSSPKEFRFCSRVDYESSFIGRVELCAILTNYKP